MLYLDILSPSPVLYHNSSERYASSIGVIFSALTTISFISLTLFFGWDIVAKQSPSVSFSESIHSSPKISNEDFATAISIHYAGGETISEIDKKLSFQISFIDTDSDRKEISQFFHYPMIPCSQSKNYNSTLSSAAIVPHSDYFCPPDDMTFNLENPFGTPKFTVVEINVAYCSNNSNCYSKEFIAQNLTDIYMHVNFQNFFADSFDAENPLKPNIHKILTPISKNHISTFTILLRELFFSSEEGWMFTREETEKAFTFDSVTYSMTSLESNNIIARVMFGFDQMKNTYKRKYIKAQDIVAQVTGATKIIAFVFRAILKGMCCWNISLERMKLYKRQTVQFRNEVSNQSSMPIKPVFENRKVSLGNKFRRIRAFRAFYKEIFSETCLFELCALHKINKKEESFKQSVETKIAEFLKENKIKEIS